MNTLDDHAIALGEHREEELRHNIRAELDYSTEPEAMLNPYGCPLE